MVRDAELEAASPGILSRARNYARLGQVVSVRVAPGEFTAAIQGTAEEPYSVALRAVTISGSQRTDASCDCPYGCDLGWCKHAAALAYVAAHLLDTDPRCRATWTGEGPGTQPHSSVAAPAQLLERLLVPVPAPDMADLLRHATTIVPLPAALAEQVPRLALASPTADGAD